MNDHDSLVLVMLDGRRSCDPYSFSLYHHFVSRSPLFFVTGPFSPLHW